MIGDTIIPTRNGAVSRSKSIGFNYLSVLLNTNTPITTTSLQSLLHHQGAATHAGATCACQSSFLSIQVAGAGSTDGAAHTGRGEAVAVSTYLVIVLSLRSDADVLCCLGPPSDRVHRYPPCVPESLPHQESLLPMSAYTHTVSVKVVLISLPNWQAYRYARRSALAIRSPGTGDATRYQRR